MINGDAWRINRAALWRARPPREEVSAYAQRGAKNEDSGAAVKMRLRPMQAQESRRGEKEE